VRLIYNTYYILSYSFRPSYRISHWRLIRLIGNEEMETNAIEDFLTGPNFVKLIQKAGKMFLDAMKIFHRVTLNQTLTVFYIL
jgi:hypothetical protein